MNGSWGVRAASVLGAAVATAAMLSAGTAQAAGDGSVKVCNDAATLSFFSLEDPPRNGMASFIVNAGECRTFYYDVRPGEQITVHTKLERQQEFQTAGSFTYKRKTTGFHTSNGGFFID